MLVSLVVLIKQCISIELLVIQYDFVAHFLRPVVIVDLLLIKVFPKDAEWTLLLHSFSFFHLLFL